MTAPGLLLARLEQAVATMPALSRAIYLSHRLDGLDYRTIAARTGLTVAQVERQVAYAIAHLDRALDALERRGREVEG